MAIPEFTTEEVQNEEWRPIGITNGLYSVSNLGRVRREANTIMRKSNRWHRVILKAGACTAGYLTVCLKIPNGRKSFYVHELVAEAFIGERPNDYVINHKNHNRSDGRLINLEYCSQYENLLHASRAGRLKRGPDNGSIHRGETNTQAKLSEDDVRQMRACFTGKRGEIAQIARRYHVTGENVSLIIRRRAWRHI